MTDRQIEYVPLDDLKADPKNPKSHDLATIDASYSRFGVVDLITVDGRTGYIISGHGRTTTLRDAYARGEEAPDGVRVADDGSWLIPVNSGWSSKNDAEAAAALIAMNRVTEMGGWVDESLLDLLKEISESGAGFDGIGFSETDMDDLEHLLEDVPDLDELAEEWDPDDVPSAGGGSSVTIKLTDVGAIERWHEVRDTCKNDDEAARMLFGMDPAPKPEKKAKKSRNDDPTLEDLGPEEDAAPAVESETPAVLEDAPEDDAPARDDGLDWDSAATVPEGDGEDLEIDLSTVDLETPQAPSDAASADARA